MCIVVFLIILFAFHLWSLLMAVESIKLKESQYYIEEFKDFKSFR